MYAAVSCTLLILLGAPAAYALSRFDFVCNKLIQSSLVASMGVPVVMIVLPLFAVVAGLNILNNVSANRATLIFLYTGINVPDGVKDKGNSGTGDDKPYPQKAQEFLANSKLPSLAKLRNLDPLTQDEKDELKAVFTSKLGTEAEFNAWAGGKALLPFLRLQVGISDEAIQTKFGSFLNAQTLNPMQLNYCQQIIDYVRQNGYMKKEEIQTVSPFSDINIFTLFDDKVNHVLQLLNGLNKPVS